MSTEEFFTMVKSILNAELIVLGKTTVTLGTLLTAAVIVGITWLVSKSLRAAASRLMRRRKIMNDGTVRAINRLLHYFVMLSGLVAALDTVGIDLSMLFAAGAVFAVGLGFAMQTIVQNFVSGVILLVERSITQGDVLEVNGHILNIERIGIRSTVGRTRDNEALIIPNSTLVQGTVKNYTLSDSTYLLRTTVGVTYGSDVAQVRTVLEEAAAAVPWAIRGSEARVILRQFGSSSIDFDVLVWTDDPWAIRQRKGELNEQLWWAMKDAGVTIAFPQLDVHFDASVENSLSLVVERECA